MAIVIVDDSATALIVLKSVAAQRREREVVPFSKASDALAFLADKPADVIVSDYSMPEMDGIQFTRAVREFAHLAATPIVMVTAATEPEVTSNARAAGVTHFMHKPINALFFKTLLNELLGPR